LLLIANGFTVGCVLGGGVRVPRWWAAWRR